MWSAVIPKQASISFALGAVQKTPILLGRQRQDLTMIHDQHSRH